MWVLVPFKIQKNLRRAAGCIPMDRRRTEEVWQKLKAEPGHKKLRTYKSNWLLNTHRMRSNRMAKIVLNCRANGRRRLGRPLKRLVDEDETGLSGPDW